MGGGEWGVGVAMAVEGRSRGSQLSRAWLLLREYFSVLYSVNKTHRKVRQDGGTGAARGCIRCLAIILGLPTAAFRRLGSQRRTRE